MRTPVKRPFLALLQTMQRIARGRDMPRARADSLREPGTSLRMSSVVLMMTGNIRIDSASDPAKPEKCPVGTTTAM